MVKEKALRAVTSTEIRNAAARNSAPLHQTPARAIAPVARSARSSIYCAGAVMPTTLPTVLFHSLAQAAPQRRHRLAEGECDRRAADRGDEVGERAPEDTHLLALEVGHAADRHPAEEHLRGERHHGEQLDAVFLAEHPVDHRLVGLRN